MSAPAVALMICAAVNLRAGDRVVVGECSGPVTHDPIRERGRIVTAFICREHGRRHPLERFAVAEVVMERP